MLYMGELSEVCALQLCKRAANPRENKGKLSLSQQHLLFKHGGLDPPTHNHSGASLTRAPLGVKGGDG